MRNRINERIFYHIYPLGMCGTERHNDLNKETVNNLEKIHEWIPYLVDLGINAVYLGPLFESRSHGYDTIDYFKVDRRLGTNLTLKNLISEFHKNGICVILDGVFHHTGRDFFAFSDLRQKKWDSPYKNWFVNVDFGRQSPYNDNFSYDGWNGHQSLVKLNLNNPEVKNHIFSAVKFWIEEFDIDGLRLDAADYMDTGFLSELGMFAKSTRSDFWLMGEVIHGDYRKWANDKTLDSVTNYEVYKGLWSGHNDINFFEIAYSLKRQFGDGGMYKNIPLYNFADNHDVDRVLTVLKNPLHAFTLYLLLFTIPGIPSLYYGSEWGIKGKKGKYDDYDLRPELTVSSMTSGTNNQDLYNAVKKFINIRKNHTALKYGYYKELFLNHSQLVFSMDTNDENIIVCVNSDNTKVSVDIPLNGGYKDFFDVLNNENLHSTGNKLKTELYPNWGRIIVMKR